MKTAENPKIGHFQEEKCLHILALLKFLSAINFCSILS